MTLPPVSSRRAFTLIELLVVIAILGVLMTLLFPAVQRALETAKKVQAKNDATQIATAIAGYVTEYGRMPEGGGSANTDALWDSLTGADEASNPRKIVFLEVPKAKSGKNGRVEGAGPFKDSWNQDYQIVLDDNYDNKVTDPDGEDILKTVIVWSTGTPVSGSPNADSKKFIKSWE